MQFDPEAVARSPIFAGLVGAVLALRGTPGATLAERCFNVMIGFSMAWFLTPALVDYFRVDTPNMQSAVAFAVGMFGVNIMATVLDNIRGFKINVPFGRKD
jgi:hypothetical protein